MWYKYAQKDKTQPSLFFDQWSDGNEIKNDKYVPKTLYHGTTHDFNEFIENKTNPENYMGQGFYFTDSPRDLNINYATNQGVDLTSRIENMTEQIMDSLDEKEEWDENLTWDEKYQKAKEIAKERLIGPSQGHSLPVYLKMKNPLNLDPHHGTIFSLDLVEDEDGDIVEETGNALELQNAILETAYNYENVDGEKIWNDLTSTLEFIDGVSAYQVDKALRENTETQYIINESGELAQSQFISDIYKNMGYDGIIMDAYSHFGPKQYTKGMSGVTPGTKHYIVWNPNQIKSSIGNNGIYNPQTPNITQ